MKTITFQITDQEAKALEAHIESIEGWTLKALQNKARKCIDNILDATTIYKINKMTQSQKYSMIDNIEFEPYSEHRQEKHIRDRIVSNANPEGNIP